MIIEVGILFGVYGMLLKKKNKAQKIPHIPTKKAITVSNKPSIQLSNKTDKKSTQYLKLSALAVVVSAAASLVAPPLGLIAVGIVGYLSFPRFERGFRRLFTQKKFNNDLIILIGLLLGIITAQYFALSLGMCLYYTAKKIQSKTRQHAEQEIIELFDNKPKMAWLFNNEVEIEVAVDTLVIDDIVIISTGEVIPVDGVIIQGNAIVDQSILTGESKPVEKSYGESVLASTVVLAGKIQIKVEKTGLDTIIASIGKVLNQSIVCKTEVQSKSEGWAEQAALPFLAMGVTAFPLLGVAGATVIFRSTFSASIELIASLELLSHLRFAYAKGIFIKDGRSLEKLNDVDTVLFDKTGTLTNGSFDITKITSYSNDYDENTVLHYASIAEHKLNHPIATAIIDKAIVSGLDSQVATQSDYRIGQGVTAVFNEHTVQVGNCRFMDAESITLPVVAQNDMQVAHANAHSFVIVAVNQQVVGAITLAASIRPEVLSIVSDMQKQGINDLYIVSGDHEQATQTLANTLGIQHYYADILPENKANIVADLQAKGKTVCFVGDGVNDSIAMSKADVSISLSGASSVATDVSQVIFMDGTLTNFAQLFELSAHLNKKLRRGLFYTLSPSAFNIASVVLLHSNLLMAILVDYGFLMTGLAQTIRENKITFTE